MYVLTYFSHDYDLADFQILATASRREPLEALVVDHRRRWAAFQAVSAAHWAAVHQRAADLTRLARAYLERNRHALREKRTGNLSAAFFDRNGNWQVEEVPEWHTAPGVSYPPERVARLQDELIGVYADQRWRLHPPYNADIFHTDRLDAPFEEPPGLVPPTNDAGALDPDCLTITDVPHLD